MFETLTAVSHSNRRNLLFVGPAAAAAHALLIGGAVVLTWLRVEDLPPPELTQRDIIFRVPVSLTTPSQGGGGGAPSPGTPGPRIEKRVIAPPRPFPDSTSLNDVRKSDVRDEGWDNSDPAAADGSGSKGPEGAFKPGGCAGCPAGPPGDGEGPFLPGGDVSVPVLVYRVEPLYPEAARKLRIEGTVSLEAIITREGAVEEVRVVGSVHPLLDEAAARALKQWRYRPGTLNGHPVRVLLTVTVKFDLHG